MAHTVCLQLVANGEMTQLNVLLPLELLPVFPYVGAGEGQLLRLALAEGQPKLYQLRFVVADSMFVGVIIVYLEVLQRVVVLLVHFPGEGAVGVADLQIVVRNALHAHTAVLAHRDGVGVAQLHRIDGEHEFLVYAQHHEAAQHQYDGCQQQSHQRGGGTARVFIAHKAQLVQQLAYQFHLEGVMGFLRIRSADCGGCVPTCVSPRRSRSCCQGLPATRRWSLSGRSSRR